MREEGKLSRCIIMGEKYRVYEVDIESKKLEWEDGALVPYVTMNNVALYGQDSACHLAGVNECECVK